MARPRSNLDDFLDWQARLESYKASGLDVDFILPSGRSFSINILPLGEGREERYPAGYAHGGSRPKAC